MDIRQDDRKASPGREGQDNRKDQNQEPQKKDAPFSPNFPQPNGPEIVDPQADKGDRNMPSDKREQF